MTDAAAEQKSRDDMIRALEDALKEKDTNLSQLKLKTKYFVQEMRAELQEAKEGRKAAEQESVGLRAELERARAPHSASPSTSGQIPGDDGSESIACSHSNRDRLEDTVQALQAELGQVRMAARRAQEELAVAKEEAQGLMDQLSEVRDKESKMDALRRRIKNLQEEVEAAKGEHGTALNELAQRETEAENLREEVEASKREISQMALMYKQERNELTQQSHEVEKQLQEMLNQRKYPGNAAPPQNISLPQGSPIHASGPDHDPAAEADAARESLDSRAIGPTASSPAAAASTTCPPTTPALRSEAEPATSTTTSSSCAAPVVLASLISVPRPSLSSWRTAGTATQAEEGSSDLDASLSAEETTPEAASSLSMEGRHVGDKGRLDQVDPSRLDGSTQHLVAQLREREATVAEKTVSLERALASVAALTEERDFLQKQLDDLGAEKEALQSGMEQLRSAKEALEGSKESGDKESDRLRGECVRLESLVQRLESAQRAHEDQIKSVQGEAKETVERVRMDAATEVGGARSQVEEAERARRHAENAATNLRVELETVRRSVTQGVEERARALIALGKERESLAAELEQERENGQERRRQMKQYLETLTGEKEEREAELSRTRAALETAKQEQGVWEESALAAREQLRTQAKAHESEIQHMEQRLRELDRCTSEQIMEKDAELARLIEEQAVRLSSTARQSEEMEIHLKAVEAETAAHKQKRLAAKNEMISLAQALEAATTTSRMVDESIEHTLVPRCLEHLSSLAKATELVDVALWQLKRHDRVAGSSTSTSSWVARRRGQSSDQLPSVEMGRLPAPGVRHQDMAGGAAGREERNQSMNGSGSPSVHHLLADEGEDESAHALDSDFQHKASQAQWESDHRAHSRSTAAMERLQRLDVESAQVSAEFKVLTQSLERLLWELDHSTEDGSDDSRSNNYISLCSKILRECFSYVRHTSAGLAVSNTASNRRTGTTIAASRALRPARQPYAVLGSEEGLDDRVIDSV